MHSWRTRSCQDQIKRVRKEEWAEQGDCLKLVENIVKTRPRKQLLEKECFTHQKIHHLE